MSTPARLLIWIFACAAAVATAGAASAPEFAADRGWLHLNGYSHHFAAPDANNKILGLGYTWYVRRYGARAVAWEADAFQDSAKKFSGYVGRSWTFRLGELGGVGVTGALMYHRNFKKQTSLGVLPVALPYLELRGRAMKLRAYYIPPVRDPNDHQIALQVMLPVWR